MIRVLAETMTSSYDSSSKYEVLEFADLLAFKQFVMKHFPKISVSLPDHRPDTFGFGIQCGDTADGFWFRWLYAIMDGQNKCLYSTGDRVCQERMGLPTGKRHCSASVKTLLELIEAEVKEKKNSIVFVE